MSKVFLKSAPPMGVVGKVCLLIRPQCALDIVKKQSESQM